MTDKQEFSVSDDLEDVIEKSKIDANVGEKASETTTWPSQGRRAPIGGKGEQICDARSREIVVRVIRYKSWCS